MPDADARSLEHIESGYVTVDSNWLITSFNDRASRILGLEGKDSPRPPLPGDILQR